ncbi:MAG: SRPBCC family protein [Rhodanobacteraceae bacterium]|jgi:hypothetical protein|nr:SRPBCC family protein [Rhodanobacteraceae bacterium]MBL0039965.1 SRPBCC family protein [Xanthomonadales bacterium]MBP6078608.1 SRPBCC family protein [Xanthomonadales bacterium]MBP7624679.1 SRPBCC family protein [Xanthomonadales bacterium]
MTIDLAARHTFSAAPAAVFALAVDGERFPVLFRGFGPIPGLRRITLHGPLAAGVTRDVEGEDGVVMLETVTALEPGRRHAYSLSRLRPPLSWLVRVGHADWTFSPEGDGAAVIWRYRFELATPLAWPLAAPLLTIFMQGAMRRCLAAMAQALA